MIYHDEEWLDDIEDVEYDDEDDYDSECPFCSSYDCLGFCSGEAEDYYYGAFHEDF